MPKSSFTTLFPTKNYAPGLAIYLDSPGSIVVTSTDIEITSGVTLHVIPYVGKTIEEVSAQISTSSSAFDANALNRSGALLAGSLYLDSTSDVTMDGGQIIRIKGHILRYSAETRLRALAPYHENRLLPWYAKVDRGSLSLKYHGVRYLFSVPEYYTQEWSLLFGQPYVDQFNVQLDYIDVNTVKAPKTPIHWVKNNFGIVINGVPLGGSIIKDIDVHNGLVKLNTPIDRTDDIRANYVYREDYLIYKDLNLNPSPEHNPSIVNQTAVLYLRPYAKEGNIKRVRTVYHSVSKTLTGAVTAITQNDEPVLIMGAFQVKPSGIVQDFSLTDTRTRGGGIKEEKYDTALTQNREAYSVADFGRYDGVPFPAAASGVLSLPRSVLNRVTDEYIEATIKRHLAVGGRVLIDYRDGE
jgi:hypothetical protein